MTSSSALQDRRLTRLSQLLKILRETVDETALLEATVPFLTREMGYQLVWFGLYDNQENCLLGHEGASPGQKRIAHRERFSLEAGSLIEQVVVQRRPLHVPDLGKERQAGKWQAIAQNIGIQGSLLFPIHYLEVCYGVVLLGLTEWGMTPQPDDVAALSILCGQLAVSLHQAENHRQAQQQKRPEEPLLRLLEQLRPLASLEERLQCIVDETHQFVGTSRTLLYWFDPQTRSFQPRLSRQNQGKFATVPLAAADCERLYQMLKGDRLLSISDTDSALQAEISSYLKNQLRVRSLMAAPIGSGADLLGFILVAGLSPHLWSDAEKRYLQGVGQLATLVAPMAQVEQAIGQGQADQAAIAALGSSVRNLQDWKMALRETADYLFGRLKVDRLILVQQGGETADFPILCQFQCDRRKLLAGPLGPLNQLDQQLLTDHAQGLIIEDWETDLRLMRWRAQLGDKAKVRSLMACLAVPGAPEMGILLATKERSCSWSGAELQLLQAVAQQLATVLHQRSLMDSMTQLQGDHQALHWGLTALQQETDPTRVDAIGVRAIAQLIKAPWVTLLAWSPRDAMARVAASYASESHWSLAPDLTLDTVTEPLLQALLQSQQNWLSTSPEELPPNTSPWLPKEQLKHLLLLKLMDPTSDTPQGAILVGHRRRQPWTDSSLALVQILAQQLSWSRRIVHRVQHLQQRQEHLEQLNWYKQFCGERFHLDLADGLRRLGDNAHLSALSLPARQTLERLEATAQTMASVFQEEHWDFQIRQQSLPLITLLKQAKQQIDPVISARKLWCQFHWSEVQQYQFQGDVLKLAGIIQSVLVSACDRCLMGGRLDVWCRPQRDSLEFSIADNGILDPRLLAALQPEADLSDPLVQSMLEDNPGLPLRLSQALIQQLGGSLALHSLEDGRTMTILLAPGLRSI